MSKCDLNKFSKHVIKKLLANAEKTELLYKQVNIYKI